MKKKIALAIFIAVCLSMALTLSIGFVIHGPSSAGANERLSSAPTLRNKDNTLNVDYLSDLSQYFSQRFYLRQELISVHNAIVATVFGNSAEDDVILGSDGWLYYTPTIGDYTATELLSERAIGAAAGNIALIQEYIQGESADFVFTLAPNKNSLYSANMPDYGVVNPSQNAQALLAKLDKLNVSYVDLFDAFSNEYEILYFAHDSHWNSKGAALAADLINEALGVQSNYFEDEFSAAELHAGDLYEMLYPAFADSEMNPVYGGVLEYESTSGGNIRPDSIAINTAASGEGNLLAFRDSFGNLLYPYLADSSATARFSRATSYDLVQISELNADRVLIEIVERNISYLITYCPIMPAPQRSVSAEESIGYADNVSINANGKVPECVFVSGSLGCMPDQESPIYVLCGEQSFEAFCIGEDGFAAYIPEDSVPTGLAFCSGGKLVFSEINKIN